MSPAAEPKQGEVRKKENKTTSSVWILKISRALTYHIPLYLIVITLLAVALPKNISAAVVAAITGAPITNTAQVAVPRQAPAIPVTPSTEQQPSERTIADVAKLALDGSKDKYDSIKDTYDRLFSVIAAMAALIAFLGFKGVDSFVSAKQKADETVQHAEEAQQKAKQSLTEVDEFINKRYPADNRAEINAITGILMRHIADAYKQTLCKILPDHKFNEDVFYIDCIDQGIRYLSKVEAKREVDTNVLTRAIITKGNLYRRKGQLEAAITLLEELQQKYGITDDAAIYNIACYACEVAKNFANQKNSVMADRFIQKSLDCLRKTIQMSEDSRGAAKTDPDFQWFRDTENQTYLALVG